jgi:rhomboid family protein
VFPLRDNVSRSHPPVIVAAIIALNVAVFLYQLTLSPAALQAFLYEHALVPLRYFSPNWAWQVGLSPTDLSPLLTNTFLHGGFLHIALNLWTLWIFGPALEDRLGPLRFLALYLASGVLASAAHAFFNAGSAYPLLGASGAIAGVIAAYAVRFPLARIRTLLIIVIIPLFVNVPAMVFAGIWFFVQVMQATSDLFNPFGGSGVAWWAHVGGFIAGVVLLNMLEPAARESSAPTYYNGGPWEHSRRR